MTSSITASCEALNMVIYGVSLAGLDVDQVVVKKCSNEAFISTIGASVSLMMTLAVGAIHSV
jgi:hypothetical protein